MADEPVKKKHKHKKGDKVQATKAVPSMNKGKKGTVHSVHYGAYYGIHTGVGVAFVPETHIHPCPPPAASPPAPPSAPAGGGTVSASDPWLDETIKLVD